MFFASKLLSVAVQPLTWVAILLVGGLLYTPIQRKVGLRLIWVAGILFFLQGWEPLPDSLIRHLEAQSPVPASSSNLTPYVGVVVLGGALEPDYVSQGNGQVALNEAAERMTTPIALTQQYPHLQVLFTGGQGELLAVGRTEADRAKIFFDSVGISPSRVRYESASHTTYENAKFSATVAGINPAQPWLLMTSAWHMPRALATFRKAGWNVTSYPVDFRAGTETPWTQYSLTDGAKKWRLVSHELTGLMAYRMSGWI